MNLKAIVAGIIMFWSTVSLCADTSVKKNVIHTYVTNEIMTHLTDELASTILAGKDKFNGIVIITRGGLHGANLLARKLKIKNFEVICLESYQDDDNSQKQIKVIKDLELPNGGEGWLIFDDLSDTGETFRFVQNKFPKAKRACYYVKPQGKDLADFYALEVPQNNWLTFAYEKTVTWYGSAEK